MNQFLEKLESWLERSNIRLWQQLGVTKYTVKALNRQYKSIHWEIIWVTALPNVVYHYEVYGSPIMVKLTFP